MPYQIFGNDDLGNDDGGGGSKKGKFGIFNISPFYIHLFLVVVLFIGLIMIFMSDFSFDLEENMDSRIVLIGDLEEFERNYSGNLEVFSSRYNLETEIGSFEDNSKSFEIENFSGKMMYVNNSIIFSGVATKIKFGGSLLNLDGGFFKLFSTKKTTVSVTYDELLLNFENGRIKLGETFNYELIGSEVKLLDFNNSMTYDGTFSFVGISNSFNVYSKSQGLNITYFNSE